MKNTFKVVSLAALAALGLLAGCDKNDGYDNTVQPTVPARTPDTTRTDATGTTPAARNVNAAGENMKEGATEAGRAIKEGTNNAVDATGRAVENAGEKMQDSTTPAPANR